MIVTAALNWWNEPVEMLRDVVSSVAGVADRIVAVDGAYRRYPGATIRSDRKQRDVIVTTAISHGMLPRVVTPNRLWSGQVEKRTKLMRLAAQGSDWIFVVDADYFVVADGFSVRRQLEEATLDVYEVPLVTPPGEYATNWHRQQAEIERSSTPLFYRALPDIRVEKHHWWYSGMKGDQRVWLWGGDERYPKVVHGALTDIRITHMAAQRSHEQVMAARSWYNDVDLVMAASDQEDDADGLPPPEWVIDRVPF